MSFSIIRQEIVPMLITDLQYEFITFGWFVFGIAIGIITHKTLRKTTGKGE